MSKQQPKKQQPRPYTPPRIEEEEVFERVALSTCGKGTPVKCGLDLSAGS